MQKVGLMIENGVIPDAVLNAWFAHMDMNGLESLPVTELPPVRDYEAVVAMAHAAGDKTGEFLFKEALKGQGLRLSVACYKETGKYYDSEIVFVPKQDEGLDIPYLIAKYQTHLNIQALPDMQVVVSDTRGNMSDLFFKGFHGRIMDKEKMLEACKNAVVKEPDGMSM